MQKIACEPMVGSDMEVFLAEKGPEEGQLGGIVPCVGIFKGTKARPWQPSYIKDGYAMQEDNVMCEFNVKPADSADAGVANMRYAKNMVITEAERKDLVPVWDKVHHNFRAAQLDSKQARTFGCESDFDAYVGGTRRTAPSFEGSRMRSCGGHVHLGGDFKCPDFVAALFAELFIGVNTDGICTPAGKKNPRKDWYGAPGIFRPKPYGIEYRTPDNKWVSDEYCIYSMYSAALHCAKYLTETPAEGIQKAFRAIPWAQQREFMIKGGDQQLTTVVRAAINAGIPL